MIHAISRWEALGAIEWVVGWLHPPQPLDDRPITLLAPRSLAGATPR